LNVKNLPFANAPTSLIFVSQCNKFEFYISSSTPLLDSKNKVLRRPVELTAQTGRLIFISQGQLWQDLPVNSDSASYE